MTDTTWLCPRGHEISAADRHDMWCDTCHQDVIAFAARPADPPEYQPDEDDFAAAYQAAMETP